MDLPKPSQTDAPPSVLRSKKSKKKKGGKGRGTGEIANPNGTHVEVEDANDRDDIEEEEQGSRTPLDPPSSPRSPEATHHPLSNGTSDHSSGFQGRSGGSSSKENHDAGEKKRAGPEESIPTTHSKPESDILAASSNDTAARLDALAREREVLREEVAQVRKSLEEMQEKHDGELNSMREQLADTQSEKEQAESQYRSLLGKVNTIKSQLGERLKADAEDLSQARNRIEELEEQIRELREQNEARSAELAAMAVEGEQRSKELSGLRNRSTLSQQNWSMERNDLIQREAFAREEFEAAKQAMQDWEVLAMEERSIRESIAGRVADLEEQVASHREAHERAATDRDTHLLTVEGLQRTLQEIQDARRRELREVVEDSQTQVERLHKELHESESRADEATSLLESKRQELDRALPFEKEVREKNLLIGKLRHEAVILNDHLTKALRYLKKGKPEDTIDKLLVTNHFLHFLALERADPKKFQVLQIIANLLGWTDEQREQAGLARPGGSNPNLKVPISPWHRTPSTPALSTDFFPEGGTKKESLAELWSGFLEQEAQEGHASPKSGTSVSSGSKPY